VNEKPWFDPELDQEDAALCAYTTANKMVQRHGENQSFHTQACSAFYDGISRGTNTSIGSFLGLASAEAASQYNVIASVVDTFTSHIVKNRVKLFALTSAGRHDERQRAEGISRALEAVIDAAGLYGAEGTQVAKDGCLTGDGVVKVTPDYENHTVKVERCLADEFFVDDSEARLGHPAQLLHVQRIDRALLRSMYPKCVELIDRAPPAKYDEILYDSPASGSVADKVLVYEMWHLPSGYVDANKKSEWGLVEGEKPTHDGRHVIFLAAPEDSSAHGASLRDEPWPLQRFPVPWFRPKTRTVGFRGRGFVEILRHVQLQINKMLRRVDGIMQLHSIMTLYLNRQANINPAKLRNNDWARMIEGDGPAVNALTHISPQAVSGDYIQQIERLIQWAFQQVGLSELSVAASKPEGIEAGVALRTLLDTESIRHTDVFRAWEDFFQQLGGAIVDCLRLLAWHDPDFKLIWSGDKDLAEIRWREVDLEDSKWRLRIWPTNLLPQTPSARLEKALELFEKGAITQTDMLSLLEFPDIEAMLGDRGAALRNIERKLDRLVRDGYDNNPELAPHGLMDLALAIRQGLARFNALEADGAELDRLDDVRRWVEDCIAEQKKIAPAPPAGPAAPLPNTAGAPPMLPPQPGGAPPPTPMAA
jgi:hypothetical protein